MYFQRYRLGCCHKVGAVGFYDAGKRCVITAGISDGFTRADSWARLLDNRGVSLLLHRDRCFRKTADRWVGLNKLGILLGILQGI